MANYTIEEFRCHFAGSPEVSSIFSTEDYKFILVGVGNSQYREIYHLQVYGNAFMPLQAARIVDMDTESILATYDRDNHTCREGYWFFDTSGPHNVDFTAVDAAISQRLPHNTTFTMNCWALDLDHQQIKTWCGGACEITAKFVLHGAKAEPETIEFEPETDH